jgi:hypothetical protein
MTGREKIFLFFSSDMRQIERQSYFPLAFYLIIIFSSSVGSICTLEVFSIYPFSFPKTERIQRRKKKIWYRRDVSA